MKYKRQRQQNGYQEEACTFVPLFLIMRRGKRKLSREKLSISSKIIIKETIYATGSRSSGLYKGIRMAITQDSTKKNDTIRRKWSEAKRVHRERAAWRNDYILFMKNSTPFVAGKGERLKGKRWGLTWEKQQMVTHRACRREVGLDACERGVRTGTTINKCAVASLTK